MNESIDNKISIKDLSEDDRPREKLLIIKGRRALTDAELLAILNRLWKSNMKQLVQLVSTHLDQNLKTTSIQVGKLEVSELVKYKGIGEAKAISIIAALRIRKKKKRVKAPVEVLDQ
jgi:DNA repair protein RadC